MNFEWDVRKAESNLQKHGIAFDDAALIFYDPDRIETQDTRHDYGEDRWISLGMALDAVLCVVYTVRFKDTLRVISARKANSHERELYRKAQA